VVSVAYETITTDDIERYTVEIDAERTITLAPEATREHLNDQQLADYRAYRREFLRWLKREGKDPDAYTGYSAYTVYETAYRCARYDAWTWEEEDKYTMPTPAHVTEYITENVAYRDVKNATKGKIEEALARYHDWTRRERNGAEWGHEQIFDSSGSDTGPRDFLTRNERRQLREAALETGCWREASIILTCR
jgi:hypothetical protein